MANWQAALENDAVSRNIMEQKSFLSMVVM